MKIKFAFVFLVWMLVFPFYSISSELSDGSRYKDLRDNFLNIDNDFLSVIDFSNMAESERSKIISGDKKNSLIHIYEQYTDVNHSHKIFGVKNFCRNSRGRSVLCWYSTGGSNGKAPKFNEPDNSCGEPLGNEYNNDIYNIPNNKVCNNKNASWSGMKIWLNLTNNKFLADFFPKKNTIPLNRLCWEIELPEVKSLSFGLPLELSSNMKDIPHTRQLVNESIALNQKYMRWQVGTYISPIITEDRGTLDEEDGGTYQYGGSHFYHVGSVYNRPVISRNYALNERTSIFCINDIPSHVRSGMQPAYAANPLLTIGGFKENATTSPSYINYLTRVYFLLDMHPSYKASYPFNIAVNKIWMMYEENDIFAQGVNGETLGQDMISNGGTAIYSLDLLNWAKEPRTYRLLQNVGSILFENKTQEKFKVYVDKNKNRVLDDAEKELLIAPNSLVTLSGNESMSLIIAHKPNFTKDSGILTRYDRKFAQGSISFIEEGRLRSASYAIRTWQGSTEDIKNKKTWFNKTQYPSSSSKWFLHREKNLDYDINSNPMLIRNSPDYKKANINRPSPPEVLSIIYEKG